jgi:hypothetical protein
MNGNACLQSQANEIHSGFNLLLHCWPPAMPETVVRTPASGMLFVGLVPKAHRRNPWPEVFQRTE